MVTPTQDHNALKSGNTGRRTQTGGGGSDGVALNVGAFLTFNTWLTPKLVKILYVLGLITVGLIGLGQIVSGFGVIGGYNNSAGWSLVLGGLATLVFGVLGVRVAAEMILVIFRIHTSLEAQRQHNQANT